MLSDGWLDESRLEESLASLEDHLIVDLEKLVYKKPSSIGACFKPVSIFKNPLSFLEVNAIRC
jgi:hypothetical protein